MSVSANDIIKKFPDLIKYQQGPLDILIDGPDHPATQKEKAIVYISSEEAFKKALNSTAICYVVPESHVDLAVKLTHNKTLLLSSPHVPLAMAKINSHFFYPQKNKLVFNQQSVDSSAVIHPTASVDPTVIIGPNSTIGPNVKIGPHSIIGPNTTIEMDAQIGENSHIHAQVFIGHSCVIGNSVEIHPQTCIGSEGFGYIKNELGQNIRIPHFGRVIIEDDVHIGANFSIDRGTYEDTIIGRGSKIDNHGHIAHNNKVGKNAIITAGFIVGGSSQIGDNYLTGGRASVAGHIHITDNVQTAAMSVVTKSIDKAGAYAGFPLQNHRDSIRSQAMIPHLPEMKRQLSALIKK